MSKYHKAHVIHRYYKITKFYKFLGSVSLKGGIFLAAVVLVFLGLEYFFFDFNSILNNIVESYTESAIFLTFFISETMLGLIPPELFIAWAAKSNTAWLFLFMLASLSYIGGVLSYLIGKGIAQSPAIKNKFEKKNAQHIQNLRKWGGFFILIGAMLPLPHSIVSMACGLINYNYKNYLFWAMFRYLRFLLYGLVIFRIV